MANATSCYNFTVWNRTDSKDNVMIVTRMQKRPITKGVAKVSQDEWKDGRRKMENRKQKMRR